MEEIKHTLTVTSIRKSYRKGKKQVITSASFAARSGECIGIIGANGSGKSTLLSILSGSLPADEGTIYYDDTELSGDKFAQHVAYVPQENPLIEELTARDNLRLWYGRDLSRIEKEEDGLIGILGIRDFIDVRVNHMSGGMKKRLSIGCAVANNPPILLLDEPGAALDLPCKERIGVYLKSQKEQGHILIIATHEEQEITLCDRLLLLRDGRLSPIRYDGNIHKLVGIIG